MENDKVRKVSDKKDNERIDQEILRNLVYYKQKPDEISNRLSEIENENDIETAFESNASVFALTGVVFGMLFSKKWLLLPVVVTGFLLQHARQGWCPPLDIFRKMGYRTRREIETEKHALKLLKGDYDEISSGEDYDPEKTLEKVKGKRIRSTEPLTIGEIKTDIGTKIKEPL